MKFPSKKLIQRTPKPKKDIKRSTDKIPLITTGPFQETSPTTKPHHQSKTVKTHTVRIWARNSSGRAWEPMTDIKGRTQIISPANQTDPKTKAKTSRTQDEEKTGKHKDLNTQGKEDTGLISLGPAITIKRGGGDGQYQQQEVPNLD